MSQSDFCLSQQAAALAYGLQVVRQQIGFGSRLDLAFYSWIDATGGDVRLLDSRVLELRDEVLAGAAEFVEAVETAERLLNAVPVSVIEPLSALIGGVPWDVRTRRTLKAIQDEISILRSHANNPDLVLRMLGMLGKRDAEARFEIMQQELLNSHKELGERILDLQSLSCRAAGTGGDDDAKGESWQNIQAELERLRLEGVPYTSQEKLAKRLGCKKNLIQKAIAKGPVELQEWATRQRAASRLNVNPEAAVMVFDHTPQRREANPATAIDGKDVDAAMKYLLTQAGPHEQVEINSMKPAQKRQLAELVYRDPDLEEQVEQHRRAKRSRRD